MNEYQDGIRIWSVSELCLKAQQDDEGILDDYYLSRMIKESWTITTSVE